MKKTGHKYLDTLIYIFPVISVYFAVVLTRYLDFQNMADDEKSLYWLVFLTATLLLLTVILTKKGFIGIEKSTMAILGGIAFFNIFGIANFYVVLKLYPAAKLDIQNALKYTNYGFLSAISGVFTIGIYLKVNNKENLSNKPLYLWDARKLRIFIYLLFAVSLISMIGFLSTGGGLLLLMDDPSKVYGVHTFVEADSFFKRSYHALFQLLTLISGMYLLIGKKKKAVLLIFLFSLFNIIMTGKRIFVLIPIVTLMFCYENYVRKISFKKLVLAGLLTVFSLFVMVNVRSGGGGDFGRSIGTIDSIFYQSMGEFTAFSQMVYIFPDGKAYEEGLLMKASFLPAFPQFFWALFGIDKIETLKPTNAEIELLLQETLRYIGSRVGVMGELFLGFGLSGILVGMYILGIVLGALNFLIRNAQGKDARLLIYNYILALMFYLVFGEWNEFFSYLWYGIYQLYFIYFLCRKRVPAHA